MALAPPSGPEMVAFDSRPTVGWKLRSSSLLVRMWDYLRWKLVLYHPQTDK